MVDMSTCLQSACTNERKQPEVYLPATGGGVALNQGAAYWQASTRL